MVRVAVANCPFPDLSHGSAEDPYCDNIEVVGEDALDVEDNEGPSVSALSDAWFSNA